MNRKIKNIALLGNPNSGKSSIFNQLTGLNQTIGNYPGVTVDKKSGTFLVDNNQKITVVDLPGTYSIYARSADEKVVSDFLSTPTQKDFPDVLIFTADANNLSRSLLLFTQAAEFKIPMVLLLNMMDVSDKTGRSINIAALSKALGNIKIIKTNARKGTGLPELKNYLAALEVIEQSETSKVQTLDDQQQIQDTQTRYQKISDIIATCVTESNTGKTSKNTTQILDKIFVHKFLGYPIFIGILFLLFQTIYSFAELPMEVMDSLFAVLQSKAIAFFPPGTFTDLIVEGVIPGLGGVFIFIPQITILFLFVAILEETGYMARVVFLMDKIMRPFGLNGKSIVPLVSSMACAIPGIMATRTIDNWKDRIITILVTPLMSCSARLPVYAILIAIVIPDEYIFGIFNLKGIVLFALYLLGIFFALGMAWVFKIFLKTKERSFLILELPLYKAPRWKNIALILIEKIKVFIWSAGRIILAISIVLWFLASYGPGERIENAVQKVELPSNSKTQQEYDIEVGKVKIENSYIGILGKQIEPVIKPLGYDWKIGIALLTSFVAREVFVGTLATIYNVQIEDDEDTSALQEKMKSDINTNTGLPLFNLPTGLSLMVFYALAMQCMSTLAIVKRETKSWKWVFVQLGYMTTLAYVFSFITFQLFS